MESYSRKNQKNIQTIIERNLGVNLTADRRPAFAGVRLAVMSCCMLCIVMLSAFGYMKFSSLNGDDLALASVYRGNGRFEIIIQNLSDRELKLQDSVKVMQWSTGEEVEGDNEKIRTAHLTVPPRSQGVVTVDLSEGYDLEKMEKSLPEGDWYYFVLTNNHFAFGQDWMCTFDFEIQQMEDVKNQMEEHLRAREQAAKQRESASKQQGTDAEQSSAVQGLIRSDWTWPTISREVSNLEIQDDKAFSGFINIAGAIGDEVYAVADGVVLEVAFDSVYGNVIAVDLGDGITVKYGHLKDTKVSQGDEIRQGQVVGTLGKTGTATGPCLYLEVMAEE